MSNTNSVPLTGSHRPPVEGAREVGPAKPDATVELTVQLAPRNPDDLASRINTPGYTPYTREEYAQAHAPSDQDIANVRQYLESHGLTVSAVSPDRRSLTVTGTVADAERAFS